MMYECFHCGKVNLSYVEWLEKLVAEYQPEWICDELVECSDEWCENNCKSDWNSECLKRYYARHFDTADIPYTTGTPYRIDTSSVCVTERSE